MWLIGCPGLSLFSGHWRTIHSLLFMNISCHMLLGEGILNTFSSKLPFNELYIHITDRLDITTQPLQSIYINLLTRTVTRAGRLLS